jgi:hypothetical protein
MSNLSHSRAALALALLFTLLPSRAFALPCDDPAYRKKNPIKCAKFEFFSGGSESSASTSKAGTGVGVGLNVAALRFKPLEVESREGEPGKNPSFVRARTALTSDQGLILHLGFMEIDKVGGFDLGGTLARRRDAYDFSFNLGASALKASETSFKAVAAGFEMETRSREGLESNRVSTYAKGVLGNQNSLLELVCNLPLYANGDVNKWNSEQLMKLGKGSVFCRAYGEQTVKAGELSLRLFVDGALDTNRPWVSKNSELKLASSPVDASRLRVGVKLPLILGESAR